MTWVKTKYSKSKVKQAGETLIDRTANKAERLVAMEIMSDWRAAHAYPMQALLMLLRKMANRVDSSAIVVQRLKRAPSIIFKLRNQKEVTKQNMSLSRMQDIAGCRAVVKTVKEVRELSDLLTNSRTRHKLHNKKDYIANPKPSGYRGIHLIYKYDGSKTEYSDYFVELQIRSKIQHAWATAVEIVDTFTKQALKASKGKKDWADFFYFVSVEFALIEKSKAGNVAFGIDTKREATRLAQKLNVVKMLNAFAVTTQHITKQNKNKADYFLLELTANAAQILITKYSAAQLVVATSMYLQKEEQAKIDNGYNVVLVSANSIHALKAAYPNYFAHSSDFIKYLSQVIAKY